MDVAISKNGARILRFFFFLVVVFLYAPILVLLIFSFNDSDLPTFPLSGFTLDWYRQFLNDADLHTALRTSAIVAVLSSLGAVALGILASLALTRRRFRGMAAVTALLLSPLVIPYIVFGISLLLFFHAVGLGLSFASLTIAHIVLSVPYTILVLVPRLEQIDSSLEEAARDLGASRLRTFRSIILPLIFPAVVSAFLIALVVVVRRVRSGVVRGGLPDDLPDLPLRRPALPESPAGGDRRRRGGDDRVARRGASQPRSDAGSPKAGTASSSSPRAVPPAPLAGRSDRSAT